MRSRPDWLSDELYPFDDHWLEEGGGALHYVDEGNGVPVLMLHGNPTWSFLYRDVIRRLRGRCRAVAPDYPGFGLSDHPPSYGYTPREHAVRVEALVQHLDLPPFVLVVHDWGGPIGLAIAVDRPKSVLGIVLCNTWCWKPDFPTWMFSVAMGGLLGRYLHRRRNFFAKRIVPAMIRHDDRKTPQVLDAYTGPFPTPRSRIGTWVFPRAIRKSAGWLEHTRSRMSLLRDRPIEMAWGMKDPAFGHERHLARWLEIFPEAAVDRIEDAGHYVQEDRPDRVAAAVGRILDRAGRREEAGR